MLTRRQLPTKGRPNESCPIFNEERALLARHACRTSREHLWNRGK